MFTAPSRHVDVALTTLDERCVEDERIFGGMKALVLNAVSRGFDLDDVDIAAPMRREVLVDVRASGLCHTDLTIANHGLFPTPSVLGHELAGVVAAVGPEVTQLRVGDHVVGSLTQACGRCARCLSGGPFQCLHPDSTVRPASEAPFKRDIPMYAELYLQGRMNLDDLVSRIIALREVNDGYAALKDGSLTRVVVTSF
jgi:Zn-dependent alcohol dehydrogenase